MKLFIVVTEDDFGGAFASHYADGVSGVQVFTTLEDAEQYKREFIKNNVSTPNSPDVQIVEREI